MAENVKKKQRNYDPVSMGYSGKGKKAPRTIKIQSGVIKRK